MGIWLVVFDNTGDLAGSISKRPDFSALDRMIAEKGDEIFADADSIVLEVDLEKDIVKKVLYFAEKYNKKVFGVVSNMVIASQRRDFLQSMDCFVCNLQEAGILFVDDFSEMSPEDLKTELLDRIKKAGIRSMVVTMGSKGSVFASVDGECGYFPPEKVKVRDTSGAGDAFCAGVSIGLTYGKSLEESVRIGTQLAASVITISESTCPRFQPQELGLEI